MILVTGATGTVGRTLVDRLLEAEAPVRALTRRPEFANLPAGVEVIHGDLADPSSLAPALHGVTQVFLLSDGPGIPAHDTNLARAAARAKVDRIVKLSVLRAGAGPADDPIAGWHRSGEQAVRDSGLAWTFLRCVGFMSNALHWADTIRTQDTVYAPYGNGRNAVIDPADIAAVAATVLTTPGHEGHAYPLTGPQAHSPGEQVDILAEALGRPLHYVDVPPHTARQSLIAHGLPAEVADGIMAVRAAGLDASLSVIHPTVERITGVPARTFRDWVERHRGSF